MRSRLISIFAAGFVAAAVNTAVAAAGADLAARIAAAAPGSTIDVPAGVYHGHFVVDKPLTLVGHGEAVLDGDNTGTVVTVAAPGCQLRSLVVRNSGDDLDQEDTGIRVLKPKVTIADDRIENVLFGIDLRSATDCVIRGNHIGGKALDVARRGDALRLFRCDRSVVEGNTIEHARDALIWYSTKVTIRRNVSRDNRYGFHMMFSNDITLAENDIADNSVGIYLMYGHGFTITRNRLCNNRGPSGYGLGMKETDRYVVTGNLFAGNRAAVYIDGSPFTRRTGHATFTGNTFACNDVGLALLPAVKGNQITGNNFVDNIEQVSVLGRGAVANNEFSVDGRGNFWGDYGGYDANHDGIGDQPYVSAKLFESLIDRDPKLRLLLFSPAHDAVEFIARAMPAVQPDPKFTDPHPLMRPVPLAAETATVEQGGPGMGTAAGVLLGVAMTVLATLFGLPRWRPVRSRNGGRAANGAVCLTGGAS